MSKKTKEPFTLVDAIRYFSDQDVCLAFMANLRWPNGIECPACGSKEILYISTRRLWECKCKHAKRQFSVKVGTVFEDSALALDKILIAIWLEANSKNSISSYELSRTIGTTQKTAWFIQQRIRLAMQTGTFRKLSGTVEVDETFIGGKARNMHKGKRKVTGAGANGKAVVMGLLERHGEVRTFVVPGTTKRQLQPKVREHVEPKSEVMTDALASYAGLDRDYVHQVIDHAECYVRGNVHTNGLENFWALFKRCIKGTHVSIEPFHLFRYLDAETFRFNYRKQKDAARFTKVVQSVAGKRLTYRKLTGKEEFGPDSSNDPYGGKGRLSREYW